MFLTFVSLLFKLFKAQHLHLKENSAPVVSGIVPSSSPMHNESWDSVGQEKKATFLGHIWRRLGQPTVITHSVFKGCSHWNWDQLLCSDKPTDLFRIFSFLAFLEYCFGFSATNSSNEPCSKMMLEAFFQQKSWRLRYPTPNGKKYQEPDNIVGGWWRLKQRRQEN